MEENIETVGLYERFLVGQFAGMGDALNLQAVRAALDIDGVPRESWAEETRRLLIFHRAVQDALPKGKR